MSMVDHSSVTIDPAVPTAATQAAPPVSAPEPALRSAVGMLSEWVSVGAGLVLGVMLGLLVMGHLSVDRAASPAVVDLLALRAPFDVATSSDAPEVAASSAAFAYFLALAWLGTASLVLIVSGLVHFFGGHYLLIGRRLQVTGMLMAMLIALLLPLLIPGSAVSLGVQAVTGPSASWVDPVGPVTGLAVLGLGLRAVQSRRSPVAQPPALVALDTRQ